MSFAPVKIICVGHAMKGTLGPEESRALLAEGVELGGGEVGASFCISDGGDGFLDAWSRLFPRAARRGVIVSDACNRRINADFLWDVDTATAVLECAQYSGLAMIERADRDVMNATSAGLGDALAAAVRCGAERIFIGIGGSATCDGGIGMLQRLHEHLAGVAPGRGIGPQEMVSPPAFDIVDLQRRLKPIRLIVCSDVTNPLLGPLGAAPRFAPQKGATGEQVLDLARRLSLWADYVEAQLCAPLRDLPGSGAAGGLGFALRAIGGELQPGAAMLLQAAQFQDLLSRADGVCITEGCFDASSMDGKAPWVVAQQACARNLASSIFCGAAIQGAALPGLAIIPIMEPSPPADWPRLTRLHLPRAVAQWVGSLSAGSTEGVSRAPRR